MGKDHNCEVAACRLKRVILKPRTGDKPGEPITVAWIATRCHYVALDADLAEFAA